MSKDRPKPVSCVDGLQWGRYVGSPDQATPVVVHRERMKTDIKSLVSLRHGDQLFALEENSALATMYWNKQGENRASETEEKLWAAVISWGYLDGSLKVSWKGRTGVFLMEHCTPDKVCSVVLRLGAPFNLSLTSFILWRSRCLVPKNDSKISIACKAGTLLSRQSLFQFSNSKKLNSAICHSEGLLRRLRSL